MIYVLSQLIKSNLLFVMLLDGFSFIDSYFVTLFIGFLTLQHTIKSYYNAFYWVFLLSV